MDDHSLFRDSLSRLLQTEPGFRMVGSCATVAEALPIIMSEQAGEQPDIILLDYDLGEEQGTVALDEIRKHGFKGRVLMVTAGMSDAATVRVLESGSEGIFLKHSSPAQLVEAIRRMVAGEPWLDPRAMRSLIAGATGKSEEQRSSQVLTRARAIRSAGRLRRTHQQRNRRPIAGFRRLHQSRNAAIIRQNRRPHPQPAGPHRTRKARRRLARLGQ